LKTFIISSFIWRNFGQDLWRAAAVESGSGSQYIWRNITNLFIGFSRNFQGFGARQLWVRCKIFGKSDNGIL